MPDDDEATLAELGAAYAEAVRPVDPLARYSTAEVERYQWATRWARPAQLPPPGDWSTWMVMAGRAFGKTRAGAEWVRDLVENHGARNVALVGATARDARHTMVEGAGSGLLAVCPPWNRPTFNPSLLRLTWPNGAIASLYTADEPERLRGPQHDYAWADELGAWRYAEAWDMLMMGLRLGARPRVLVTTTPRPSKLVKGILASATTAVARGTTYENRGNLPASYFDDILRRYEGTRLGRQELLAEMVEEAEGALWTHAMVEAHRLTHVAEHVTLTRMVVAVDPSGGKGGGHDEVGIVVAGRDAAGNGYVLADRSGSYSAAEWGRQAVSAWRSLGADRIVAEGNFGGDMVTNTILTVDRAAPVKMVNASRGKALRAEPISALYEQGRVHHVGAFGKLEDEMTSWAPNAGMRSPNRLDALVWALTDLLLDAAPQAQGSEWDRLVEDTRRLPSAYDIMRAKY